MNPQLSMLSVHEELEVSIMVETSPFADPLPTTSRCTARPETSARSQWLYHRSPTSSTLTKTSVSAADSSGFVIQRNSGMKSPTTKFVKRWGKLCATLCSSRIPRGYHGRNNAAHVVSVPDVVFQRTQNVTFRKVWKPNPLVPLNQRSTLCILNLAVEPSQSFLQQASNIDHRFFLIGILFVRIPPF